MTSTLPHTYTQTHPLLTAATIARIEPNVHAHPLLPSAVRHITHLDRSVNLKHAAVHLARVKPNTASLIFHLHRTDEEWTYIVSGSGGVCELSAIDQSTGAFDHGRIESVPVAPGDFIGFVRNGHGHCLRNTSDTEDLVYLCGSERVDEVVCVYPTVGKMLTARPGQGRHSHRYEDWPSQKENEQGGGIQQGDKKEQGGEAGKTLSVSALPAEKKDESDRHQQPHPVVHASSTATALAPPQGLVPFDEIVNLEHTRVRLARVPPQTTTTTMTSSPLTFRAADDKEEEEEEEEEWMFVISGSGVCDLIDLSSSSSSVETVPVARGDFMGFARTGRRVRCVRNTSETEDLVYLCGGEKRE
ncbi:hypothetical protein HDU86_008468 [Geranomyces michiganensis]|nr:hypothetical protein HDU86_008468 [Geranomyces michiganensis]